MFFFRTNMMANQYSVEIHQYVSAKIITAETNKKIAEEQNDEPSKRFYEGALLELKKIRAYMADKIDLKTQKYY